MNYMILVSVVLPILVGVILLFLPANVLKNRQYLLKEIGRASCRERVSA